MKKPTKQTLTHYDYLECAKYVSEKLGRDIDDYSPDEYRNFWHWVLEMADISNGCIMYMREDWGECGCEDWQEGVLMAFIEEFGEQNEYGEREIAFYVSW